MKSKQTSQYARAVGRRLNADPSHTWQRDMVVSPVQSFGIPTPVKHRRYELLDVEDAWPEGHNY